MAEKKEHRIILESVTTASNQLHHLLINKQNVLYKFDFDKKQYDFMSDSVVKLTGYTKDELNQKGFSSIVQEVVKDKKSNYQIDSGKEIIEEHILNYLIESKDKELKWVEDISFLSKTKENKINYSLGVLIEITKLNQLIISLYDEKDSLNSILNLAEIIILITDNNGKITFINEKGLTLLGYKEHEIVGERVTDFIKESKEDRLIDNDDNDNILEMSVIAKTGEERIINWHKREDRDEKGKIILALYSGLDITPRIKQQRVQRIILEILEESNTEANLQEFYNFIHSSIKKLMPADNFYISLYDKENDSLAFPYFVDQIDTEAPPKKFGRGLTEFVIRTGKPALINRKTDEQFVKEGKVELVGSPSAIWLGIPLKILDNTIGALVVQDYQNESTYTEKEKEILEVITYPISRAIERKKVEEERNIMIAELKEINNSKDKLFSLISHDLRSPFNSLLGFADILTNEYDSLTQEEIKEYINVINESARSLYGMTTNLLQFSRFQMGKFEFSPVKLSMKKTIQKSLRMLKGNILKKQLNLLTDIDNDAFVLADEDMLNSVLQNLISNAVKFTKKGGDIRIYTHIVTFFNKPHQIEVHIEDSGIGISKNDLQKVFKEHMRSVPGTEKEYGSGLGLLLVKDFIAKNNGHIKVKSKLNEGTSFIFSFPIVENSKSIE
ncbi:MAG: ATP-binding protein [Ignavibacteriaceae bacterium]